MNGVYEINITRELIIPLNSEDDEYRGYCKAIKKSLAVSRGKFIEEVNQLLIFLGESIQVNSISVLGITIEGLLLKAETNIVMNESATNDTVNILLKRIINITPKYVSKYTKCISCVLLDNEKEEIRKVLNFFSSSREIYNEVNRN